MTFQEFMNQMLNNEITRGLFIATVVFVCLALLGIILRFVPRKTQRETEE